MPITFRCGGCKKEVTAPDTAAGKKGKCPHCGRMNPIPLPPEEDDDVIPLAPLDEEEERRAQAERRALYEQEQELLSETGGPVLVPLEHRGDLTSEDLHHFVVNYCLDLADGKLPRAEQNVEQLRRFGMLGIEAVDDFIEGMATEPALDHIPRPVLQGFLKELKSRVLGR
jgi:phage FluMu protein Com